MKNDLSRELLSTCEGMHFTECQFYSILFHKKASHIIKMKLVVQGKGRSPTDYQLVEDQLGNKCTISFSLRYPCTPSQNLLLQQVTLEAEELEDDLLKDVNTEGEEFTNINIKNEKMCTG